MTATSVVFAPLLPWAVIWAAAALALAVMLFAAWRGLAGWALRALAAAGLVFALTGPSLQTEERAPLGDILLAVVDESASQGLAGRAAQTRAALEGLRAGAEARGLELRTVRLGDGPDNRGSLAMTALAELLAEVPRDRVAGAVVISDGVVHDAELAPVLPAPLHLLRTGQPDDWDRRLRVTSAPAFAILGEEQAVRLRIDDLGAAPGAATVMLSISVGGAEPVLREVPVGRDLEMPLTLDRAGQNVIQLTVAEAEGELTARNNTALVTINGLRDRLRVLLVSGEPHPGTRTWRNLLKSDGAVDLVHFTILRPPDKQDGVPVTELSLIAFPTQELFLDKIDEFDLIIFDRYKLRGILPGSYLESVRDYVRGGGAVLIAAGPDFAGAESLARSALGEVLPARPSARLLEEAFRPAVTELGARHPVTRGLEDPQAPWGRWLRQVELVPAGGQSVMSGAGGSPLLVLDRVGEGRVALLGSDQAWLWSRGFEGGGPQLELLRRLAHWMMKEPELEEEALTAEAAGGALTITRLSLGDGPRTVTVTGPDGQGREVAMAQVSPGVFRATLEPGEIGLYRLEEGGLEAVAALGPASPREFEDTIATGAALAPALSARRGGDMALSDGGPALRAVGEGRVAAGRGWIGYTPRGAFRVEDLRLLPLAPGWLVLLVLAGLSLAAWLVEGRRSRG